MIVVSVTDPSHHTCLLPYDIPVGRSAVEIIEEVGPDLVFQSVHDLHRFLVVHERYEIQFTEIVEFLGAFVFLVLTYEKVYPDVIIGLAPHTHHILGTLALCGFGECDQGVPVLEMVIVTL